MCVQYVYTVTERKAWTSFRPGSVKERHGTYSTVAEANAAINNAYQLLASGTEPGGWTRSQSADGRLAYDCDDWGHEESYELRIEDSVVHGAGSAAGMTVSLDGGQPVRQPAHNRIQRILGDDGKEEVLEMLKDQIEHDLLLHIKALISEGKTGDLNEWFDDDEKSGLLDLIADQIKEGNSGDIADWLDGHDKSRLLHQVAHQIKGGNSGDIGDWFNEDEKSWLLDNVAKQIKDGNPGDIGNWTGVLDWVTDEADGATTQEELVEEVKELIKHEIREQEEHDLREQVKQEMRERLGVELREEIKNEIMSEKLSDLRDEYQRRTAGVARGVSSTPAPAAGSRPRGVQRRRGRR